MLLRNPKVATTEELRDLVVEGQLREFNRQIDLKWFDDNVDPDGFHLLSLVIPHPIRAYRCYYFIKVNDSMMPVEGIVDVLDEQYEQLPSNVEIEQMKQAVDATRNLIKIVKGFEDEHL